MSGSLLAKLLVLQDLSVFCLLFFIVMCVDVISKGLAVLSIPPTSWATTPLLVTLASVSLPF